jgi:uncharacterized protein YndB with AHSA1/START domain
MGDLTQRGLGDFSFFQIVHQSNFNAPAERVFEALCGDISPWWGTPYLLDANSKSMVLEPRPGGRLMERWSDQALQCEEEGAIWGIVQQIADAELLVVHGLLGMDWPNNSEVQIDLLRQGGNGDQTLLKLTHKCWGVLTQQLCDSYKYGWDDLFGKRLKAWVERGERRGIGHEPLPWLDATPPPAPPPGEAGEDDD